MGSIILMLPSLARSIDLFSAMLTIQSGSCKVYRKTSAENLDFRTLLNNWDINLRFQVQSPLNIAENIVLEDESPMTDFPAKLIFHSLYFLKQKSTLNTNEPPFEVRAMQVF